jgi:uridine kinase
MEEVLNRYQNTLKPMHQQFIEPTKALLTSLSQMINTILLPDVFVHCINQRIL